MPTAKQLLPRLVEWDERHRDWMAQYEALNALTACGPEAPLTLATGRLWDAYTACVAREVGDEEGWLEWYCWDADMGRNPLDARIERGGKPRNLRVGSVRDLARVIAARSASARGGGSDAVPGARCAAPQGATRDG